CTRSTIFPARLRAGRPSVVASLASGPDPPGGVARSIPRTERPHFARSMVAPPVGHHTIWPATLLTVLAKSRPCYPSSARPPRKLAAARYGRTSSGLREDRLLNPVGCAGGSHPFGDVRNSLSITSILGRRIGIRYRRR